MEAPCTLSFGISVAKQVPEAKKNEYNTKGYVLNEQYKSRMDYYIAEPRNKFCKCGIEKTPETTSL